LQDGDFEVGDRISISYAGFGLARADEGMVVRAGKILPMGEPLGDLNLNGVLRSELYDLVVARVNKYFKDEVVHVVTSVRLSVSGAVKAAGYFYVRPDQTL